MVQEVKPTDYERYKKYNEDWERRNGHHCVEYTEWWNSNYEKNKNLKYEETKKLLDQLSQTPAYRFPSQPEIINLNENYYTHQNNYKKPYNKPEPDYNSENYHSTESNINNYEETTSNKKLIAGIIISLIIIAIAALVYYSQDESLINKEIGLTTIIKCSDNTTSGSCSLNQPFYCNNGKLIYNTTECSCPNNTVLDSGYCRQYRNCADYTKSGNCSKNKPLFCFDGNLTDNASTCGCGSGQIADGENCRQIINCSDGTTDLQCSTNQPYYCFNGTLEQKASLCGCPAYMQQNGDNCSNPYPTDTTRSYSWEYGGNAYQISLNLSSELATQLDLIPNMYTTTLEQYFNAITNNTYQQLAISDIIKQTPGNDDYQLLNALAMVQTLPYDYTSYQNSVLNPSLSESRYPYRTLYDQTGVCEDKSLLGAAIAEQMGYGVALFQYKTENHMALGIKCPVEFSNYNSGYCFLEMTAPCSKLTYNQGNYTGGIQLTSTPQIIVISDGKSLSYQTVENAITEINNYKQASDMMSQLQNEISSSSVNPYDPNSVNQYNALVDQYNYYVKVYDSFNSCNTT